ncbi:hypothetical protein AAA431_05765 [Lactobacillus crispatus]|uniref:Uncharacterized protein n=3 Tax=Lactobacillus crispatus TaxID=47770 RepID=A0A109DDT7_9LACO|nr:hypothetical protein [Lactobacillus crispatus]KWU03594.1 hypothetical protein AEL95_06485 [Lactobacillus crispatus]
MKKLGNKIEAIPIVRKLNSHRWMSLVWWSILVMILPYIFSICRVPVVWREAILFFIINSIIAYHLGNLIIKLNLSKWWIFLLPVLFCLAMLPHFALYNLMFGLIYLIIEAFGLMNKNIYRARGDDHNVQIH